MVTYADNLYLTEKTSAKLDKIKKCIETRAGMIGTVIIALSSDAHDVFELIPCYMFKTSIYTKIDLFVCGIAENNSAAQEMVEQMVKEYLAAETTISMRDYYINKFTK